MKDWLFRRAALAALQEPLVSLLAKPRPLVFKAIAPFEVHESASATGAAEPAAPSDKKLAHAADAGSDALAMDGVLDEPAWARATPIEFDTSWRGDATGAKTKVRLLWQRGALFAGFEVEGTGLLADASFPKDRDRPKLYEEDCVELFIGADARTQPPRTSPRPVGRFACSLTVR